MPIIDILGGVFGSSGSGSGSGSGSSSGSTSTTANGLSSLANMVFPGLGGILNNVLGGLSCLGSQAFKKNDYEMRVNDCASITNAIAANPSNLGVVKEKLNFLMYIIHRDELTLTQLKSSCSKQWCSKTIKYAKEVENALIPHYTYTRYFKIYNDVIAGQINVQEFSITGYKGTLENNAPTLPPVTYPPTTPPVVTTAPSYPPVTYPPTQPPVTYPPVTYPDTTTPPIYNPPVTYPDTTTPPIYNPPVMYPDTTEYPPVTTTTGNTPNSSGGLTRTQTIRPDGSITIYFWKPDGTLLKTENVPAPNGGGSSMASSLDGNIDISGNVGDWNFGLNNNKDQTLYIAGGLGLLGLIAYMAKSKK